MAVERKEWHCITRFTFPFDGIHKKWLLTSSTSFHGDVCILTNTWMVLENELLHTANELWQENSPFTGYKKKSLSIIKWWFLYCVSMASNAVDIGRNNGNKMLVFVIHLNVTSWELGPFLNKMFEYCAGLKNTVHLMCLV